MIALGDLIIIAVILLNVIIVITEITYIKRKYNDMDGFCGVISNRESKGNKKIYWYSN